MCRICRDKENYNERDIKASIDKIRVTALLDISCKSSFCASRFHSSGLNVLPEMAVLVFQ